jgi:hypothetical protein
MRVFDVFTREKRGSRYKQRHGREEGLFNSIEVSFSANLMCSEDFAYFMGLEEICFAMECEFEAMENLMEFTAIF